MSTKRKGKLLRFDPVIYPRSLWVAVGLTAEEINQALSLTDGRPIETDSDPTTRSTTYPFVMDRSNGNHGTLVAIWMDDIKDEEIAHEAFHAAMTMLYDVGVKYFADDQEPSAYMVGWVFGKIQGVVRGK